jgi:hypothetical protein
LTSLATSGTRESERRVEVRKDTACEAFSASRQPARRCESSRCLANLSYQPGRSRMMSSIDGPSKVEEVKFARNLDLLKSAPS